MILYTLLIFSLSLILLHLFIRYRRIGRLTDNIPGPRALPIIGNILSFNLSTKKIWQMIHELQNEYPIYKVWYGFVTTALDRDPDHIKVLLSCKKNINKEVPGYNNIKYVCGNNNLIVSGGKFWENRRKILNQAFTSNCLDFYSKRMDAQSKKLIKELLSHGKSGVHDVVQVFMKLSFAVVCEATMNYDLDDTFMEQKGKDCREALIEIGEICYYRTTHPYIQDWMMKFLPMGWRQEKLWKIIVDFAREVIEERRSHHASCNAFEDHLNGFKDDNHDIKVTRKTLSVLDVLLMNEKEGLIDSKGVLDETILVIGAGSETTALALTYLITSLADNKEVQDRARQELNDVMGGYNNLITLEHIKKLEYLERCAKESLRLYTVTPFLGRSIDYDVKLGEYTVPAGTNMFLNIFQLHRDPNLWPDPLKFDPDRFLSENMKDQHPFAYVPFSRGPRNCIGQKFGMNEIKTVAAHILYNFYLEPIDRTADFKFDPGVALHIDRARVKFIRIH